MWALANTVCGQTTCYFAALGVPTQCTGCWTRNNGACCHLPTASSKPLHDIAACGAHMSWQNDLLHAHHVVAAPTHCPDCSAKYCKRGKVGESTLSVIGMLKSAVTHALCIPGNSLSRCADRWRTWFAPKVGHGLMYTCATDLHIPDAATQPRFDPGCSNMTLHCCGLHSQAVNALQASPAVQR